MPAATGGEGNLPSGRLRIRSSAAITQHTETTKASSRSNSILAWAFLLTTDRLDPAASILTTLGTVALEPYVQSTNDDTVALRSTRHLIDTLVPEGAESKTIKPSLSPGSSSSMCS